KGLRPAERPVCLTRQQNYSYHNLEHQIFMRAPLYINATRNDIRASETAVAAPTKSTTRARSGIVRNPGFDKERCDRRERRSLRMAGRACVALLPYRCMLRDSRSALQNGEPPLRLNAKSGPSQS